jgi:hypothetical protein
MTLMQYDTMPQENMCCHIEFESYIVGRTNRNLSSMQ